jgi:glycosyltransferase involved in cell wall biosynthesis
MPSETPRSGHPSAFPTISIALATYNGASHLEEQLGDLANQSLLPCELVVCDDGSTDRTLDIIQDFADSAPFPVRLHRNPARVGYRQNFIQCAERCSGDLIAFCDQDDRWSSQKLQTIAAQFEDPETMLVFHNARVVRPGAPVARLQRGEEAEQWDALAAPPWLFALGFTQVFRRCLIQFNGLWPKSVDQNCDGEPLAHDQWYFFLASVIGRVAYVPRVLADYRQHGTNTYGWRGRLATLWSRSAEETKDARRAIRRRFAAAGSRMKILQEAADGAEEPLRSRLRDGSDAYREFAQRYLLRAAVYEGRSYRDRGRAFGRLVAGHGYGRGGWRFGPLGFAMDCLLGLTGIGSTASQVGERP